MRVAVPSGSEDQVPYQPGHRCRRCHRGAGPRPGAGRRAGAALFAASPEAPRALRREPSRRALAGGTAARGEPGTAGTRGGTDGPGPEAAGGDAAEPLIARSEREEAPGPSWGGRSSRRPGTPERRIPVEPAPGPSQVSARRPCHARTPPWCCCSPRAGVSGGSREDGGGPSPRPSPSPGSGRELQGASRQPRAQRPGARGSDLVGLGGPAAEAGTLIRLLLPD